MWSFPSSPPLLPLICGLYRAVYDILGPSLLLQSSMGSTLWLEKSRNKILSHNHTLQVRKPILQGKEVTGKITDAVAAI